MSTPTAEVHRGIKPFWPPLASGIALGLVLLLTFYLSGHGLGASGAATHAVAGAGLVLAPAATQANSYLGPMVSDGNPIGSWITWQVLGVAIGGMVAAFTAGRFRVQLDGARSVGAPGRLLKALAGGPWPGSVHAWPVVAPAGWACRARRRWGSRPLCSWACFSRPAWS